MYDFENQVLGFAYATGTRIGSSKAYEHTIEISIYVKKGHFRKGIGKALLSHLLPLLKEQKYHSVIGCLTIPNEPCAKLLERFGFKKCAEFKDSGYKFNQWHSSGFWQLMLEDFQINQE